MIRPLLLCTAFAACPPALAQHASYAGQDAREIKSLSAEETAQYLAGAGLGYARAAELNHFPGPMHVLELGDKLELTREQREKTAALMNSHKAEARELGNKLVEAERRVDLLFRSGKVSEAELAASVREAAVAQGAYRLSHLETHRRMRSLLSDAQVARYDALRGYGVASSSSSGHHHGKH